MERSDDDLVRGVRAGDRSAWDELVARHSSRLWAIARANGLDAASAADVVQTGWLNLIESVNKIRNPEAVGGWLSTVVRHEAIRMSKAQRRGVNDARFLPTELPPPDEGLLRSERIAAVRSAFELLSSPCRELLRLMFSDAKLTYEEIATLLDRPVGSLGPTRGRCLADLRELLDREKSYQPSSAFPSPREDRMTSERAESEESVRADLEAILADPVPALVVAAASGLWTWRTIDAELAELSEQELAPSPAGVRDGGTVEVRSYEAAGLTIEIEFDWRERTLTAQVLPSQRAELRAVMDGGLRTATVTSDSGVLELRDVPRGPLQLLVSTIGAHRTASIKTPWFTA